MYHILITRISSFPNSETLVNKLHFDNALVSEAEGLIANGLIQQYWERLARPQLTFLASNWTQFPQPYSLQAR